MPKYDEYRVLKCIIVEIWHTLASKKFIIEFTLQGAMSNIGERVENDHIQYEASAPGQPNEIVTVWSVAHIINWIDNAFNKQPNE